PRRPSQPQPLEACCLIHALRSGLTIDAKAARRGSLAAVVALCCALVAGLGVVAGPASADEPLPVYAGSLDFPAIESAAAPEEYSWQVASGEALVQLDETEAEITRPGVEELIHAPNAYDLHGTRSRPPSRWPETWSPALFITERRASSTRSPRSRRKNATRHRSANTR